MKSLPKEIKELKKIKTVLDKLMSDSETKVEIRSTELYDHIKLDKELNQNFPTRKLFNHFLRVQHDSGLMKQVIPNYRVDTSNKRFYQWFFRRNVNIVNNTTGSNTESYCSKYFYYNRGKKIKTKTGEMVRSEQEKLIYENLLCINNIDVYYDHPISKFGETVYVDFYIKSRINHSEFYWEHFGYTHNENYKDEMTKKIEWYKNNGFKTFKNNGNLLFTIYSNENSLNQDILNCIETLKKMTHKKL